MFVSRAYKIGMSPDLANSRSIVARKNQAVGRLCLAAILLLTFAAGSLVWAISQLRADARRDAFEETGNLATVLAGQLSRFVQTIDIVLAETRDNFDVLDSDSPKAWRSALSSKPTYDRLRDKLTRLPQAFNIAVADAAGQILASTASWPAPTINVADRDYFQKTREQNQDELTISSPIRNRVNGERAVVFARSMRGSSGEFLGTVHISVNISYFEIVYDSIKSVRDLTFTLASTDGTILARHPSANDRSGQRIPPSSQWYAVLSEGGAFQSTGNFDQRSRLVSVRPLQEVPLAVSVSMLEDTALSRWRARAIALGLGGSTLVACSLFLLVLVGRKMSSLSEFRSLIARQI